MLKYLFNRNSWTVKLMELLGVLSTIFFLFSGYYFALSSVGRIAFWINIALYLFIRFCALVHWHRNAGKEEGIRLQLSKAMVPTSYAMAVTGLFLVVFKTASIVYVSVFILAVVAHVNVILLYLLLKDTDKSPANYFSHNKYL